MLCIPAAVNKEWFPKSGLRVRPWFVHALVLVWSSLHFRLSWLSRRMLYEQLVFHSNKIVSSLWRFRKSWGKQAACHKTQYWSVNWMFTAYASLISLQKELRTQLLTRKKTKIPAPRRVLTKPNMGYRVRTVKSDQQVAATCRHSCFGDRCRERLRIWLTVFLKFCYNIVTLTTKLNFHYLFCVHYSHCIS